MAEATLDSAFATLLAGGRPQLQERDEADTGEV
jgi:hypothetical protein